MNIRLKLAFLVAITAAFAATAGSAQTVSTQDPTIEGEPFSSLVVFSGSLSDTGNYAAAFGDFPAPFYQNRTTNGPNVIDVFASKFGLNTAPSLHLVGPPKGLNYAVLHANAFGNSPGDLPAQVKAYLDSYGSKADPEALYFVFIGANDIVQATTSQTDQEAYRHLTDGIYAVENAVRSLHAAGAETFYAPNNVNIGLAPVALQFGVSARATQFTILFNRLWEQKLSELERELDITVFRFDFYRLIEDLMDVSGTLGFTDVTHSCLGLPEAGRCDLDRFAFINELLPTRRIHEIFGNALAEALIQQLNAVPRRPWQRRGRNTEIRSYSEIELPRPARN